MPIAMSEVGVAQVGGKVHVVGGTEQRLDRELPASTLNLTYDPATDRWQQCAPLPLPVTHVGLTELGGKLYAIGAFTDMVHIGPRNIAFAYDPKSDRWSELPGFATPRGSVAVAAVNGKIHAFGGNTADKVIKISPPGVPEILVGYGTVTTHEVFDPVAETWSLAKPLPGPPRDHMGIASLSGKIHVFGGRIADFTDLLARHDVYDPRTDSWTSAAPLPRPRSAGAYTVLDGLIIYAGGECKPGGQPSTPNTFDDVDAYDPKTNRWTSMTPLPQARHGFGAATVRGVAYFAAGALLCGGGTSPDLYALTLS